MKNKALATTFVGLNTVDAVLTKQFVGNGMEELNAVMRHMLEEPEPIFWLFKVGGAVVCASLLVLLSNRFETAIRRVLYALNGMMILICLFNGVNLVVA